MQETRVFIGLARELSIIVAEYLSYLETSVSRSYCLQLLRRIPMGLIFAETRRRNVCSNRYHPTWRDLLKWNR